ncbi:major facilitator superfamily domain-containing protein [Mycena amicta]|nr:major facilitator superfamily domain-containing protein [Mycena amicta]
MSRSRSSAARSASYTDSLLPDGPVDLLDELIHPQHTHENTLVDGQEHTPASDTRPWWKRPSVWWSERREFHPKPLNLVCRLLVATPFSTIAMSATLAPKVEVYTLLACSVHKPEIFKDMIATHQTFSHPLSPFVETKNLSGVSTLRIRQEYPVSECTEDPVVSAATARLSTAITASMGVLGCLTTGWWGSFSDRFGRTKILGFTLLGLLFNDCIFIFVTKNFTWIPGGYWFLLVGPILEGCLGGFSTASAATHAYLSDVVAPSERSRTFSLFLGVVFAGLGIGPTLGGLVVKSTHNLLSVFYLAAIIHFIYCILCFFLLPESLSKSSMESAKLLHIEAARVHNAQDRTLLVRTQRLFSFLKPLMIFFPGPESSSVPRKGRKWDWNLALLATAYGFTISIMGSVTFKIQYMMRTFGWTSEYVGYYLTIAGATRAIYMAVILPLLIKFLKGYSERRQSSEAQPLLSSSSERPKHSPSFDLALAKASLAVDIVAYTAMPLASSGLPFTAATMVNAFGGGFTPATQSVALELYSKNNGRNEAGKLFGALSVLQSLGGQILGPSIYGLVFIKTVGSFPKAIFLVSLGSIIVSFICVSLVRLPRDVQLDAEDISDIPEHSAREATLVDIEDPDSGGHVKIPQVTVSAPSP